MVTSRPQSDRSIAQFIDVTPILPHHPHLRNLRNLWIILLTDS